MANTAAPATAAHVKSPRGNHWLDVTFDVVLGVILLTELSVLFINVIGRWLFRYSFTWSDEIAQIALTAMTFLGGAIAYRRGEHMSVRAVVDRLSDRWKPYVSAFESWVVLGTTAAGFILSLGMLASRWDDRTPVLGLRLLWVSLPLSAGMVLLILFSLERLWRQRDRAALLTGVGLLVLAALGYGAYQAFGPWESSTVLLAGVVVFAVTVMAGVPIGFVLPLTALLYLTGADAAPAMMVPMTMQSGITSFVMLAVPFFILAGYLMTEGGLSRPLADAVTAFVGHLRGGLLQVVVVSMYIFSGISGAKVADVAAVGTTMNSMLKEQGYDPAESVAVLASSAIMGETVPPSIAMLVLGSITTLSVGSLFMAGIVPALVMALCLMGTVYVRARILGLPRGVKLSWSERGSAIFKALPAITVPLILVGGIMTGVATPTEVSSFAVVYALLLSVFLYRAMSWDRFRRVLGNAATVSGMILFIISAGSAFSWALTIASLPQKIAALLTAAGGSTTLFLVGSIIVLIIAGSLLEGLPALLIFGPLLLPVAAQFHVSTLQYAIVLIFAMGMGTFAPPVGVGMYVACAVGGASMEQATKRMLPYLFILFVGLLIVAFVPWFSLALPRALHMGM